MIEMRWLLEPGHPSHHPDAKWTLQYRYLDTKFKITGEKNQEVRVWSDWMDVPWVSEE